MYSGGEDIDPKLNL